MTTNRFGLTMLNLVATVVLGLLVVIVGFFAATAPLAISSLMIIGLFFALKTALNLATTRRDTISSLAWVFNAVTSAVLFFVTVFALGLNERAWRGSVQSSLNTFTLDPIFQILLIVAGATILAQQAVRVLPRQGIKRSTLWLILLVSMFGAMCAYLYPRNGMLMHYDTWVEAGMPGKPNPADTAFWAPILPGNNVSPQ